MGENPSEGDDKDPKTGGGKREWAGQVLFGDGKNGVTVRAGDVMSVSIVSEIDHPDSFALMIGNRGGIQKDTIQKIKLGDPIEARTAYSGGKEMATAFVGDVTGIEPIFDPTGRHGDFTMIRGLNGLHALSRGKRSCAYSKPDKTITDAEILQDLLKERYSAHFDTTPDYGKKSEGKQPPDIGYPHVYQHNQTDLEFIRHRAARIGYYVLSRREPGKKSILVFQQRTAMVNEDFVLTLDREPAGDKKVIGMTRFAPRKSTANQVTKVTVRCFDPKKRMEMIRFAPKTGSGVQLGEETGKKAIEQKFPESEIVRSDIPFSSIEEGDALAASILNERVLSYVTAEGTIHGDPRLQPGMVVKIKVGNPEYDGPYFITYVQHKFRFDDNKPYETDFRAKRDATSAPAASK